jgi:hypothetical protein
VAAGEEVVDFDTHAECCFGWGGWGVSLFFGSSHWKVGRVLGRWWLSAGFPLAILRQVDQLCRSFVGSSVWAFWIELCGCWKGSIAEEHRFWLVLSRDRRSM